MRENVYKEIQVTKKEWVDEKVICDLCGFDEDSSYVWPVIVALDPEGCAGTIIKRDVCQDCYEFKLAPFTDALFKLLKADDKDLNEHHESRWYG